MARPRSRTDEEIFAGLERAIGRCGPDKLALSDVAGEVGLSAAALVQRFGSKRQLLLAYAGYFYGRLGDDFDRARGQYGSPLSVLIGFLCDLAGTVETPEELANHVAYLYVDLTDPDFYRPFRAWAETLVARLEGLLEEAVAGGELRAVDPAALARAVWTTYNGALLTWAIHREGEVGDWMRAHLNYLLAPLRPA